MLTTTSTIAFRFREGIIIAADTAVSYGRLSLCHMNRIFVFQNVLVAFNGFVGDFHDGKRWLEDEIRDEKREIDARGIFKLIQIYLYTRRSQMTPKACSVVVAGLEKTQHLFLGCITSKGVFWEDNVISTGFAAHFITPLLRTHPVDTLSLDQAESLIKEATKIMVYKDACASNRIQIAVISHTGEIVLKNEKIYTDWTVAQTPSEIIL